MATTTYGTPYVAGTDLVANWPAASLTVANSIDAAGYFVGRGINAQTASYTTVLTDAGKTVSMTNAGATTLTIPANSSVAYVVGTRINILNLGAGACTPTAGAGVTIAGTITALATNQAASVIKTATNTWSYVPFSSGTAAAVITSSTGSPTITTNGTATVYTFTGDGTLVVGTAGAVRLLVCAGGGGGGYTVNSESGAGGGAGGYAEITSLTLEAGTWTVKVGAAGAGALVATDTSGTAGGYSAISSGQKNVTTLGGGPGKTNITYQNTLLSNGGSGGGANYLVSTGPAGISTLPTQGFAGGNGGAANTYYQAGGGGGATAAGTAGNSASLTGAAGGAGAGSDIVTTGSTLYYSGGGGAGKASNASATAGAGGSSVGGAGGTNGAGNPGTTNRGGGGGGGGLTGSNNGGAGGSGVVIVRVG